MKTVNLHDLNLLIGPEQLSQQQYALYYMDIKSSQRILCDEFVYLISSPLRAMKYFDQDFG